MVQMTKRQRLSAEEVMAKLAEQNPAMVEHIYQDRDWLWYCGPSLRGDEHTEKRKALLELGFRYSKRGHLMPDKTTVGSWGNSCLRPLPPRRFNKPTPAQAQDAGSSSIAKLCSLFS